MSVKVVGTIDGFQLPTQIRGWAKRLDDGVEPVRLRLVRNGATFAETEPNQIRADISENPAILSGFTFDLPSTDDLLDVLLGKAALIVESDGAEPSEAAIWDYGRAVGLAQLLQLQVRDVPSAARDVLSTIVAGLDAALPVRSLLHRLLDSSFEPAEATASSDPIAPVPSVVPVAVGTPSIDRTAVIGQDGWLFLVGGSNDLLSLYGRETHEIAKHRRVAAEWIDLHQRRITQYARPDRRFIQMIVPEKTSVLSRKLPFHIEVPTYCLGKIERTLVDHPNYLSITSLIPSVGAERFYRRTDTHPSPQGNFAVVRGIAERLGVLDAIDDLEIRFDDSQVEIGDLAERFFRVPILENLARPTGRQLETLQPAVTSSFGSSRRTQSGTVWKTPNAPLDFKVAVFGNSVFEHGASPLNLSWWCARLFRELYFFWLPETLPDMVDEIGADVVIAQTVERFLFTDPPAI